MIISNWLFVFFGAIVLSLLNSYDFDSVVKNLIMIMSTLLTLRGIILKEIKDKQDMINKKLKADLKEEFMEEFKTDLKKELKKELKKDLTKELEKEFAVNQSPDVKSIANQSKQNIYNIKTTQNNKGNIQLEMVNQKPSAAAKSTTEPVAESNTKSSIVFFEIPETTEPYENTETAETPKVTQESISTSQANHNYQNQNHDPLEQLETLFDKAKNWLLGGNIILRVGLLVLFLGLTFLIQYIDFAGILPIELRLALVGFAGAGLLFFGFRQRDHKRNFSLALQGGGVAIMYLTIFATFKFYQIIPHAAAFIFMLLVCALGCALALLQNSMALAISAFAGGFAAPILLSNGQGNHVGLFSYYLLLNLTILALNFKRAWRPLNLLGFLGTFVVSGAWQISKYQPEQYMSTQPFLAAFILIYLAITILYAEKKPTKLGSTIDSTLMLGVPIIGFSLQRLLVERFVWGDAFSALAFGFVYILAAFILQSRQNRLEMKQALFVNHRLLIQSLTAMGVIFATMAIPFAFDQNWTSALWAFEGLAAFWIGARQNRWLPRLFAIALQVLAALIYWQEQIFTPLYEMDVFIKGLVIGLTMIVMAWWTYVFAKRSGPNAPSQDLNTSPFLSKIEQIYQAIESKISSPLYLIGFALTCVAWVSWISYLTNPDLFSIYQNGIETISTALLDAKWKTPLIMLILLVHMMLSMLWGIKKNWVIAIRPCQLSIVILLLAFTAQLSSGRNVLDFPAYFMWPLAWALHFGMLYLNDKYNVHSTIQPKTQTKTNQFSFEIHIAGVWVITLFVMNILWKIVDLAALSQSAWGSVIYLTAGIIILMFLSVWATSPHLNNQSYLRYTWPRRPFASAYYGYAALPIAALILVAIIVIAISSPGQTVLIPYIPLLNPTDLSLCLGLASLLFWYQKIKAIALNQSELRKQYPYPEKLIFFNLNSAQENSNQAPTNTASKISGIFKISAAIAFLIFNTIWLRIAHHFFGVTWSIYNLFSSSIVQAGYAILWSISALFIMLNACKKNIRQQWLVGATLLGLVVAKLFLIDLSNITGFERIIAFISVGILMLLIGYFAPLPPKHQELENINQPNNKDE